MTPIGYDNIMSSVLGIGLGRKSYLISFVYVCDGWFPSTLLLSMTYNKRARDSAFHLWNARIIAQYL